MQNYYAERLILVYIDALYKARAQDTRSWLSQEDGNPSHGIRKQGLAHKLKEDD